MDENYESVNINQITKNNKKKKVENFDEDICFWLKVVTPPCNKNSLHESSDYNKFCVLIPDFSVCNWRSHCSYTRSPSWICDKIRNALFYSLRTRQCRKPNPWCKIKSLWFLQTNHYINALDSNNKFTKLQI